MGASSYPRLKLEGETNYGMWRGEPYDEPGWTCTTRTGASCNSAVIRSGSVDNTTPGRYILEYSYTDHGLIPAYTVTKSRLVNVYERNEPILSLRGNRYMRIELGERWQDPWIECRSSQ